MLEGCWKDVGSLSEGNISISLNVRLKMSPYVFFAESLPPVYSGNAFFPLPAVAGTNEPVPPE